MDKKAYKEYKRKIRKAVATVDNKPPKFEVAYYYKKRNLTIDANRVREIDKENMELLKRMSIISRTGGKVDCWMAKTTNTPFHRIVSGYWCQGGDVTKFNGSGGASAFGDPFENENFDLRHAGPGILSMCGNDEDKNDSKFNLTFRRLETMNGKHVVFGKVISGLSNIYKIEEFGTKTGKPIKAIVISNCGIISRKHDRRLSEEDDK